MIRLRFALHSDFVSQRMASYEGVCMPFSPAHVEAVMPDGRYLGMHFSAPSGMQYREAGADSADLAVLPDGRKCELFVEVSATPDQTNIFYSLAVASIGEPYDIKAFIEFGLHIHGHERDHAICSAKMLLLLRGAGVFRWPVVKPAHDISPSDLLLMLSVITEVPH